MELIILGSSAAYAPPGRACSGYLVREGETSLWLDCGTGTLSNLFRWMDPADLSAVIITHWHVDHFLDIYSLRYYLQFTEHVKPSCLPIQVIAPSKTAEFIARLLTSPDKEAELARLFDFQSIEDFEGRVGSLKISFQPTVHNVPTYGVRIEGEKKLAYSSDSDYDPSLIKLAQEVDLFLCEATLQRDHRGVVIEHVTSEQAAEIAKKAGAKKLVLTHIWPTFDVEVSKREAVEVFPGEVILAQENMEITI